MAERIDGTGSGRAHNPAPGRLTSPERAAVVLILTILLPGGRDVEYRPETRTLYSRHHPPMSPARRAQLALVLAALLWSILLLAQWSEGPRDGVVTEYGRQTPYIIGIGPSVSSPRRCCAGSDASSASCSWRCSRR